MIRRRMIDLALRPASKEAQLLHRYEREHEKSLYAAIRGLLALEKSGADLPERPGRARARRATAEAVVASAGPEASENRLKSEVSSACVELASVGEAAPPGVPSGRSAGSPGRPGRPTGADPGPGKAPKRR